MRIIRTLLRPLLTTVRMDCINNKMNNQFNYVKQRLMIHTCCKLNYPRRIPQHKTTVNESEPEKKAPLAVGPKYKVFQDSDADIILDTSQENITQYQGMQDDFDEFEGINLKHGVTGVFDIEDLVEILKRENARDIFVASVPTSIKYVDYMCVVTGRSPKHILAIAEFIRKLFKRKRNSYEGIPIIEGKQTHDWMALDLGNIALHIFSSKLREVYDLETLWSVGYEYDSEYRKDEDSIVKLVERHSIYLHGLKPATE